VTTGQSAAARAEPGRVAKGGERVAPPRLWDVLALAVGAVILRIPAYFAPMNLGYDDGGYGLAAIAMREGYDPFRDIFSSQGPLFLPLLRVADLVGFQTFDAPRILPVVAGAVATVAVYFAGLEIMDRGRAILAAALTGSSGILLWTTGPITSDGTAAAISISAVAVALAYRRRPATVTAIVIAVLAGSAFSVKNLLVTPALVIAWLLVVSRKRVLDALLVPLGALAVLIALSIPWGLKDVYSNSIEYHLHKTGEGNRGGNLGKLVTTYLRWSTILVALGAVALVTAIVRRLRGGDRETTDGQPAGHRWERWFGGSRFLWWWAGLVLVVLLAQDPMFRNHLAALVAPFALLVARYRPSWKVVAVVVVVTIPFQVSQLRELLTPKDYSGDAAVVVDALRNLPDGAWALSDEPGFTWRAGKGTDPYWVDPSVLRIDSDIKDINITEAKLLDAAANPRQCAVVVWAPVRFGRFEHLPQGLERLGYRQVEDFGDRRGLWLRERCDPSGRPADRAAPGAAPAGRTTAAAAPGRSRG
jgi:4-amino-4-deoxy-L-arabinose transferase-like glycosyltransferase